MSTAALALARTAAHTFDFGPGFALPYRLFTPAEEARARGPLPLVLFLHGAGERGNDNEKHLTWQSAPLVFTDPAVQERHPCWFVAPQCPEGVKWCDMDWTAPRSPRKFSPTWPLEAACELVRHLAATHPGIDRHRIVVTGLSMGGFGAWDCLVRWPTLFRAGLPICGGHDESAASALAATPIWTFHAEDDTVISVDRSRNMVAAVRAAGGDVRYTEFPAADRLGHGCWNRVYRETPAIFDFLLAPPAPATGTTAAPASPPAATAAAPADPPVRVGLVGGGIIVRDWHLKILRSLPAHFQVVAIADRDEARREARAAEAGTAPRTYPSHVELLQDPAVEAVLVAVPPYLSSPVARDCLRAGKHVLVEKPMGNDEADARALLEVSRQSPGVLMVAEQFFFAPGFRQLAAFARDGAWPFGPPLLVRLHQFWRMTPETIPQYYHSAWRHDPRLTHGYLIEGGCHTANPLREAFGLPDPATVRCQLLSADPALGRFDTLLAHGRFENGGPAFQFTVSYGLRSFPAPLVEVLAPGGTISTSGGDLRLLDDHGAESVVPCSHGQESDYHAEWLHFHEVIRRGTPSLFTAAQGHGDILFVQRLLDAALAPA